MNILEAFASEQIKNEVPAFNVGDTVSIGLGPGNATGYIPLYCVWQAKTYTISYNANGGSGAPASQTKTYGTTLTLSSTKPTRSGYDLNAVPNLKLGER